MFYTLDFVSALIEFLKYFAHPMKDLIKVNEICVPFFGGEQTSENVGLQTWRGSLRVITVDYKLRKKG